MTTNVVERGYGNHMTFFSPTKNVYKETPLELLNYSSSSKKMQGISSPDYLAVENSTSPFMVHDQLAQD